MNKETALERVQQRLCGDYNDCGEELAVIETALKNAKGFEYADNKEGGSCRLIPIEETREQDKKVKAFDVIRDKRVDVGYLFEMIDLFGEESLTQYNLSCYGIKKKLTQKEFDLLKEVLK